MTEKQFKFIEEQLKDEIYRDEYLSKKAQIYLSINSLMLTALIFKTKDLKDFLIDPTCLEKTLTVLTFVSIFISFLFVLFALGVFTFERPTAIATIIREQDDSITDDDFMENRAADYLTAFGQNARIGDSKAKCLITSLVSMIVGFTASQILVLSILL